MLEDSLSKEIILTPGLNFQEGSNPEDVDPTEDRIVLDLDQERKMTTTQQQQTQQQRQQQRRRRLRRQRRQRHQQRWRSVSK